MKENVGIEDFDRLLTICIFVNIFLCTIQVTFLNVVLHCFIHMFFNYYSFKNRDPLFSNSKPDADEPESVSEVKPQTYTGKVTVALMVHTTVHNLDGAIMGLPLSLAIYT